MSDYSLTMLHPVQKFLFYNIIAFFLIASFAVSQSLRPPFQSLTPAMNATGVEQNAAVTVTFDTSMLPATFGSSTVYLYGDRTGRHFGDLTYDQVKRELTVKSAKKFVFGEQLQFILTDSVGTAEPYHPIAGGFGYKFLAGVLRGNGQFSVQEQQVPSTSSPYAIAAGDFNGDGYTDCAVTHMNSASVSVYINTKRNGFFPPVSYPVGTSPEAIVVSDLSGDGYPDIIVANRLSNNISIMTNNGNGTFSVRQFPVGKEPVGLAVADCENDGALEIAVVTAADSSLRLYRYHDNTLTAIQSIPLSGIPSAVVLDDMNNDGYIDCAVTIRSRNSLVLFKNDSTGKFSYDIEYTVGSNPVAMIAFDAVLGPDGFVDLATVNSGSNTISILKNDQTGHFQGPEHFAIGGMEPVAICGNDFDGDGDVDLAISNRGSKSVVIFRNNGGALPDTVSIPLSASPHGIVALDITGTYGIMDLVVCDDQTGALSILRNGFISPPSPELTLEHDSVHFNQTALNDTNSMHSKVFSAITPTTIDSIRCFTGHFFVANPLPLQLASYDSADISLGYAPKTYGAHRDSVIIYSTAGVFTIHLRGESPAPLLSVSSSSIDFGGIKLGDTSIVTVKAKNLTINRLSITSVSNHLPMISIASPPMPVTLGPMDSVAFILRFIPDSLVVYSDTLRIVCDPLSATAVLPLHGQGKPTVNVTELVGIVPPEFMLGQNYPNPFNPLTTIPFALPHESSVRIDVYDLIGRKVSNLLNEVIGAGYHTVLWNAADVSSGVYYYRMVAVSLSMPPQMFTNSKKILLVK